MKKINVNENENFFTVEQREALTKCHNEFFYAMMADRMADQVKEEKMALRKLQEVMPNVVEFHAYFDGTGDIIYLAD